MNDKTDTRDKLLKNVDDNVWRDLKVLSVTYGLSMAETIKKLVDFFNANKDRLAKK